MRFCRRIATGATSAQAVWGYHKNGICTEKRGPGTALQHQVVQVPLHDHILYALHRLVEEICVGGIREVNVGVLFGISHQIPELGSKKLHSGVDIRVATAVFGEVV